MPDDQSQICCQKKFLLISMLLIFIWIGWLLVLCTYSIWTPSSFNVLIPKELPIQLEDNTFTKKKDNCQIISLEGFSLFDAKYLLLKIQLIYLMAGWVTLMDNALSNYPRQCALCWHTLPILYFNRKMNKGIRNNKSSK